MASFAVLLAYFGNSEEAQRGLEAITSAGFSRCALLYRELDEPPRVAHPARRAQRAFALVAGIAGAIVAYFLAAALAAPASPLPQLLIEVPAAAFGYGMGVAAGYLGSRWLRPRATVELLKRHAALLAPDEHLVVTQVQLQQLRNAAASLREVGEAGPTLYMMLPERQLQPPIDIARSPLPLAQVQEHAARLAQEARLSRHPPDRRLQQRLERIRRDIHAICGDLSEAARLEVSVGPTVEWILDNEYVVEGHVRDVQSNLSARFYRSLPALESGTHAGLPRVYAMARELIQHTDLRIDKHTIGAFLEAFQSVRPLMIAELWALPQMIRIALVEAVHAMSVQALDGARERQRADHWAHRLLVTSRRDAGQLFSAMAALADDQPEPSFLFGAQLTGHLYDEEAALVPVQSWLERTRRRSLPEIQEREQSRQAHEQLSIGNAISSLRQLALMDWRQIFERNSRVDGELRADPARLYAQMDFETRNRYRDAVETLARMSGWSETDVAAEAIRLAREAAAARGTDDLSAHVGSYLQGEERRQLRQKLDCREPIRGRLRGWIYQRHTALYLLCVAAHTGALLLLGWWLGLRELELLLQIALGLLAAFPASQLAVELSNFWVTQALPPRILPKMDFEKGGILDEFRTLVTVPVLLDSEANLASDVEQLEIRALANPDTNLVFSLFVDYTDAAEATQPDDRHLLTFVQAKIEALNQRHGRGRFMLFQRQRTWAESEDAYIGWERKRGKLEELNRLICGLEPISDGPLVVVGDPGRMVDFRFVITLDRDTQLPRDSGRRLVETLAHPLNRPRVGTDGRVLRGYTIIQPRVTTSLPSSTATPFSRLFTDPIGIDPYTRAVSDAYQDLTGEGSYHGKGIYDPRAFQQILDGRFPEQRLLSHDLIEGAHVRVGLATDIELFDEFPDRYLTFARRGHRWIRGDWQIAAWILPRVPTGGGGRGPNPLSLFNRWKIFDNLRRSLVAPAAVLLLLAAWLSGPAIAWFATILVAAVVLSQPLALPLTVATSIRNLRSISLSQIQREVLRGLAKASLLPYEAGLALDAIVRVLYRLAISRKRLLQWTTSHLAGAAPTQPLSGFLGLLAAIGTAGAAFAAYLALERPASLPLAAPWIALWLLAPASGWLLNRGRETSVPEETLAGADLAYLRHIARRTWRFFDDFVNEETAWLPPDNFQVSHRNQLALRTSPTNIGMWLLSALAAHDLGYLPPTALVERLKNSLESIRKLERFQGHLLNWYSLPDLEPLSPRYVSFVDSGNFVAALWTLTQGLQDVQRGPVLSMAAVAGIGDTVRLLGENLPDEIARRVLSVAEQISQDVDSDDPLAALRGLQDYDRLLSQVEAEVPETAGGQTRYWADQARREIDAWIEYAAPLLEWMTLLGERSEVELLDLGVEVLHAVRDELASPTSLQAIASGQVASAQALEHAGEEVGLPNWAEEALTAYARAQRRATSIVRRIDGLIEACSDAEEQVDFRFLYDRDRRLFAIGYNVDQGQSDGGYYDMLASEARLGSYVAIARDEVRLDHWFSMSRPYGSRGRGRVLMSWTGTMFEYLMPHLLQRTFPNTLLHKAVDEAIKLQIDYARNRGVPWGISESAYGDLDFNRTYQYRAFGVPWLGLKRGLEEDLVVAPYATMLALPFAPKEGVQNLRRLERVGLSDGYGFFEAIDYNRRDPNKGGRGVLVRAYMAHHQGMSFLAITNLVQGGVMQARFHRDLRVQAVEPLLYERVPVSPVLHHLATREEVPSPAGIDSLPASVSEFQTPHTITPRLQLLSNGRLHSMVTVAGGGYTRWEGLDITRWRADTTRDDWGSFTYLRDLDSDQVWSAAHHPIGGESDEYEARFPLDRAEIRRHDSGIETATEVIVSPDDDVEIRRMTLTNRSLRMRHIELTSYMELVLAPHRAERQHPAFNSLFIQTEAVENGQALLARRRRRSEDDHQVVVGHRLTQLDPDASATDYETDRAQFVGRGRSRRDPEGVRRELAKTVGYVLDPIFSLRTSARLLPGQSMTVSSVVAVASTKDKCLSLLDKYSESAAIERAFELSWASTQLAMRMLRIQPDEARRFQKLASFMLYPSAFLRPPVDRLRDNVKGQSGLWPYGISGDDPILLVSISEAKDIGLVRQLLQAHSYWGRHGLLADLVIVNEESSSYERPLKERLEQLIQAFGPHGDDSRSGKVHLVSADQLPPEDLTLLQAVARVSMVAARGPLSQQLGTPSDLPLVPETIEPKSVSEEPPAALPYMELPYFNGLGGFSSDGTEYVIYLGPEETTPAPWINVISNPNFGTLVTESGAGFSWFGNSQRNRLTEWSNDPVMDPTAEAMYLRDEDSGVVWSPTPGPIRDPYAYRVRHRAGSTTFEHNGHGLECELTMFVPMDEEGGNPVKVSRLRLYNDTDRRRRISLTYFVEWTLGEHREDMAQHIRTQWEEEGLMLAFNPYHPEYGDRVAFVGLSPTATSYTGDRTVFLGRNGALERPKALMRERLSERVGAGLDPCAALQTLVELEPGETVTMITLLGQAAEADEARALAERFGEGLAVETSLNKTHGWWDHMLGAIQVETPEMSADLMLNRWLRYQSLSCRMWGRSAFYQSGGAIGFRDQLQDSLAWMLTEPDLTREQILEAAGHQFEAGDVQHWWHPPSDSGIRSRISDDLLWLPYVTAEYVRTTGDTGILSRQIPFLQAPELGPDEHEVFLQPTRSPQRHTLYEHCRRAVERGLTVGPRGLPLIGTGDWNDGMNRVGVDGRGESVWLAWFLVDVLKGMAELARHVGDEAAAERDRERARDLLETIDRQAWDGAWYLRATFDSGAPLGSSRNQEGWIDLLPQAWAWIAGGGDPRRAQVALESAWRYLVQIDNRLVLLFTPPFDRIEPSPGYIRGYPPGVRENGGQYTHAALWYAIALARSGDGDRAVDLLRLLNPIEYTRDMMGVSRYRLEPYVVAADVYRLTGNIGRGGWSWYTGSAAWMYRAWIEEVLGLHVRGDTLELRPTIPRHWGGYKIRYRHGQAMYWIQVLNPEGVSQGVVQVELDGRPVPDGRIPLESTAIKHRVTVRMGESKNSSSG